MAGEFLLIQGDLGTRREVVMISAECQMSVFEVIGRMVVFWDWATSETEDGFLPDMDVQDLSVICPDSVRQTSSTSPGEQHSSFWSAVEMVGWISFDDDGIRIPNWKRWLDRTSQAKHLDKIRKRIVRAKSVQETSAKRPPPTGRFPDRDRDVSRSRRTPPSPPEAGVSGGAPGGSSLTLSEKKPRDIFTRLCDEFKFSGVEASRLQGRHAWSDAELDLWAQVRKAPPNGVHSPAAYTKKLMREYRLPADAGVFFTGGVVTEEARAAVIAEIAKTAPVRVVLPGGEFWEILEGGTAARGPYGYKPLLNVPVEKLKEIAAAVARREELA